MVHFKMVSFVVNEFHLNLFLKKSMIILGKINNFMGGLMTCWLQSGITSISVMKMLSLVSR